MKGIGYRDRRWDHAAPDAASDLGPGPTIEVSGDWDFVSLELGREAEAPIAGYRYLTTSSEGVVALANVDPATPSA